MADPEVRAAESHELAHSGQQLGGDAADVMRERRSDSRRIQARKERCQDRMRVLALTGHLCQLAVMRTLRP